MSEAAMFLPLDADTYTYIVQHLRQYPVEFGNMGATTFIHPSSYRHFHSTSLETIRKVCRLQLEHSVDPSLKTSKTAASLTEELLAATGSIVSFVDTLAFTQSLCLLQIIALLTPDVSPKERAQGTARQQLLTEWTYRLWLLAPSELPPSLSRYQAYVLGESVRRTILVSHKLQACYRISLTGFFKHTLFVESLPLGSDVGLWENEPAEDLERTEYRSLYSYREMSDRWDAGLMKATTKFEKMLLAGCKGSAAVQERYGPEPVSESFEESQDALIYRGNL
jgi:hypothetical protein